MSRLTALFLALGLFFGLSACGNDLSPLEQLQKDGKMAIAVCADNSPYCTELGDGRYTGLEIDILDAVCDRLGVLPEYRTVPAAEALSAVESGEYRLAAGMQCADAPSGAKVLYTSPYAKAALRLLVKEETPMPDVRYPGALKLAVCGGSYAESYCVANAVSYTAHATYAEAVRAVQDGTADGLLADEFIVRRLLDTANGENKVLKAALDPVDHTLYAFALAESDQDVADRIGLALSELLADGTLHAIYDSYGLTYTSPNG